MIAVAVIADAVAVFLIAGMIALAELLENENKKRRNRK